MPDLSVKSKGFTLKSCVLQFQTYSSDLCPFLFYIFLIKVSLVDLCSHRIIETVMEESHVLVHKLAK